MISIQLSNLTLILGAHAIFRDLTWEIQDDQKIGLVGPNGAGKSSLFKLMIGEYTPEKNGSIVKAKGVTLGYLSQQPEFDPSDTALSVVLQGKPRIAAIDAELHQLEVKLGQPEIYNDSKKLERTLNAQSKLIEEYESLGGSTFAGRSREVLRGLGLADVDIEKNIGALSGGQKKLIGLARLLLAHPSLLLLDEPDNHLDIPGKAYLEQFINGYNGAVVLISHDRYLLDACVTHITEIEDGKLTTFVGNYTEFIIDKEQRLAKQEELYQIQKRGLARMELAIKRYRVWVQFNDKFASRIHAMEARIARVDKIDKPILDRKRMDFEINGWRGSNQVLEFVDLEKSFEHRTILNKTNLLIRHGERIGLIGANGAGKSVFLRMILGRETPTAGEVKIGPSIKVGYYAQEHETLDFNQTLIDVVRHAGEMSEGRAVSFLTRYLFPYRQATQRIGSLSGGERSRLQLALLVLSGSNFLLLDEPTNNLDIASAEVLENSLMEFDGTVLVISHDRYFLDRTVNKILCLENGKLTEYIGGYSDYAEKIAM